MIDKRVIVAGVWIAGCAQILDLEGFGTHETTTTTSMAASGGSTGGGGDAATGGGVGGDGDMGGGGGVPESVYQQTVLMDNPIAYWRLGERSGTTAIDLMDNVNGTYEPEVIVGSPGLITGDPDLAAGWLDNGNVVMEDVFDFAARAPYTLEAWVEARAPSDVDQFIIHKRDMTNSGDWKGYSLAVRNDAIRFRRERVGASALEVMSSEPVPSLTTIYVVATYDGDKICLYIDAVLQQCKDELNSAEDGAVPFRLGVNNFQGTIDEVAVYNGALAEARIKAHFDAGAENP